MDNSHPLLTKVVPLPFMPLCSQRKNVLLTSTIDSLVQRAEVHREFLKTVRLTLINTTSSGGGVSEMLHSVVPLLQELGISVQWLVLTPPPDLASSFYALTKTLHNAIHNSTSSTATDLTSPPSLAAFSKVGERAAECLLTTFLAPVEGISKDFVIVHDPQPTCLVPRLRELLLKSQSPAPGSAPQPETTLIWRCHIGSDTSTPISAAAWTFLHPFISHFDTSVFSSPLYVPPNFPLPLATSIHFIPPALDPSSAKNREMPFYEIVSTLARAGITDEPQAKVEACGAPSYFSPAVKHYLGGGVWRARDDYPSTTHPTPLSTPFLSVPVLTQISRWDRLKGFKGLLEGFAHLKQHPELWGKGGGEDTVCQAHLCLAGPDPSSVTDDPEGMATLAELAELYDLLPPAVRADVSLLLLPMTSLAENALMVNALQRSSFLIVQNSLEEGWGLTCLEAQFKRVCVIGTQTGVGLRSQIKDGVTGLLTQFPEDPVSVAHSLLFGLHNEAARVAMSFNAQSHAVSGGLIFSQVDKWLSLLFSQHPSSTQAPPKVPLF